MEIGVLLFETAGCRLLGDPGYPGTFEFPVKYGVVKGSYRDLIEGSEAACTCLCEAARTLESEGAVAIVGDCGLMGLYQKELAEAVHVPVVASSLALLPLMQAILPADRTIGILTGHSGLLGAHHLRGASAERLDGIVIQGMENEPHFREVVIEGTAGQSYSRMLKDVLNGVRKLRQACGETAPLGAVLLECSNLAVFGAEITEEFNVPVFDINTAVYLLAGVWEKKKYYHNTEEE